MRRIVDSPAGSSGFGRVNSSMYVRCRSVTGTPKSASSSAIEPYTSIRGYAGSSDLQIGIGVPQKRFRLIDQSRAPDSHLPNCPSLTCSGTQLISPFSSPIRSLILVTSTNQLETAM